MPIYRISPFTFGIVAVIIVSAFIGTALTNFDFPWPNLLYIIIFSAGLETGALIVRAFKIKDWEKVFWLVQFLILIVPTSIFCQMLLCIGASFSLPLIDEKLIAFDHMLGFDWRGYFTWIAAHPTLLNTLNSTYNAMASEIGLALCLLVATGRYRLAEKFIFAYFFGLAITIVIASLWPSMGGYVHYDMNPAALGIPIPAARVHEADLLALRHHTLTHFPVVMNGVVTFPSFHTVTAVLLIWAFWPFKYLRLPSLVFNSAMIVATLASGGHYLADVLAGLLLAFAGIAAAHMLLSRRYFAGAGGLSV